MSYNGSGTFNINSAGQPVVSGTVISSTAFNALTSDLATGLTTALTKDGQTTPTANITLGGYKITNLAAATLAADAVRFSQLQAGSASTYITAAGADTITGTVSPTLTAYTTGQQFSFVAAGTNTTAVTLNIDGVGVKAVTRAGTTALAAGDILTGQVAIVEYDGTRFQLLDPNAFTNLRVSGTLGVTGVTTLTGAATLSAALTYGGVTLTNAVTGTGKMVLDTSPVLTTPVISSITNTGTLTLPTLTGTVGLATRTVQVFTSGSGTYTTPTGCKAIWVRMSGGGGGGGGSGTASQGAGGAGGTSTFGSAFLTCNGGGGGTESIGGGGNISGGSATGGDVNLIGGNPAGISQNSNFGNAGTSGGSNSFGGAGGGGRNTVVGSNGAANSGGGGGGAGGAATLGNGSGGGAGGYLEKLTTSPSATYAYAIGAGGAAGAAGTSGSAGGVGGSGIIIVTESY